MLPTGPDFMDAFFGTLLAGAVPVPLYPPVRLGRLPEYHAATARMLQLSGAVALLSDGRVGRLLGEAVRRAGPRLGLRNVAALRDSGEPPVARSAGPGALALVQFSSGSTVDPKPVALSHRAVLAQTDALRALMPDDTPEDPQLGVSWLPLYHDMGLIGCLLSAMTYPGPLVLLGPEVFLGRPALWLRALSRHRGTMSVAPSFAYAVCARRVKDEEMEGADLSRWRLALNGAEQVSVDAARRFSERFSRWGFRPAALMPVYGLAEAALAVTFSPPRAPLRTVPFDPVELAREGRVRPGTRRLASVGVPVPGVTVEVRDEGGAVLPEGVVGRIHARGPSIMEGYVGQPEATRAVLAGGWLDTGDLGFVQDGELVVCGRAKDVVVLRGANHAPQEFEDALEGLPGVRAGLRGRPGVRAPRRGRRGAGPAGGDDGRCETGPGGPHPRRRRRAHRRAAAHRAAARPRHPPPHVEREAAPLRGAPALDHGHAASAGAGERGAAGGRDAEVRARPGTRPSPSRARAGDVSMPAVDVAVVGGGPAGLALAAMAARRGLSVVLLERAPLPHDKACGEGVMPAGLGVLERLGVLGRIPDSESGPIRGVRYVQEDGSVLEGALPGPGGLGIRRTALSSLLLDAARAAGADVRDRTALRAHRRTPEAMRLEIDGGQLEARVLVAADGLHSPLRRAEGLELPSSGAPRFGLRQHFVRAPWTDRVEVHLSRSAEAYVTPCGPSRVGVAFLWSHGQLEATPSVASLLARFPFLAGRLAGALPDSRPRGAGPFLQRARRPGGAPVRAPRRRGGIRRRHHRRRHVGRAGVCRGPRVVPPGRGPARRRRPRLPPLRRDRAAGVPEVRLDRPGGAGAGPPARAPARSGQPPRPAPARPSSGSWPTPWADQTGRTGASRARR